MPPIKRSAKPKAEPSVDDFLARLDHPLKPIIESLRRIIRGVSPAVDEGIKWNSPSFRTADWFATINLRARDGTERVWLILHTGAKAKGVDMKSIPDPANLLDWLGNDRALVTFAELKDLQAKRKALEAVLREWVRRLPS